MKINNLEKVSTTKVLLTLIFIFFIFYGHYLINYFVWYFRFDPDAILSLDILTYNSNEREAFFQHPGFGLKILYGLIHKVLNFFNLISVYDYSDIESCNNSLWCVSKFANLNRFISLYLTSIIFLFYMFILFKLFKSSLAVLSFLPALALFSNNSVIYNSTVVTTELCGFFFIVFSIFLGVNKNIKINIRIFIILFLTFLTIMTKVVLIYASAAAFIFFLIVNFEQLKKENLNFYFQLIYILILISLYFFLKDYYFEENIIHTYPVSENPNTLFKIFFLIPFLHLLIKFIFINKKLTKSSIKNFVNKITSVLNIFYICFSFYILFFLALEGDHFLRSLKFIFFNEFTAKYNLEDKYFLLISHNIGLTIFLIITLILSIFILIKIWEEKKITNFFLFFSSFILLLLQIYSFRPVYRDIFQIFVFLIIYSLIIFSVNNNKKLFFYSIFSFSFLLIYHLLFQLNIIKEIQNESSGYGHKIFWWMNSNYCIESMNIGSCEYSDLINKNLNHDLNSQYHLAKFYHLFEKNLRKNISNCDIEVSEFFVIGNKLNIDFRQNIRISNFDENYFKDFSGVNLKYLKCNKIYPNFNIQINNNQIVGNGDYDIMIKNSDSIYSISENYIYDQIYKKQNIFKKNIKEIFKPKFIDGDAVVIPERDSSSYIFTNNSDSIKNFNLLLKYGLIKEISKNFELTNFDGKIFIYKINIPIQVNLEKPEVIFFAKSFFKSNFWY